MLRCASKVYSGILENRTAPNHIQQVLVGSRQWFEWLGEQRSFAFVNDTGSFTSRKEKRPGGWYWYAYRRMGGKLRTAYLGKTEELYLERLNKVARILATPNDSANNKVNNKPETRPGKLGQESVRPGLSKQALLQKLSKPHQAASLPLLRAKNGLPQAIQQALSDGEMERAASLIEQNVPTFFQLGEITSLKDWLAKLPPEMIEKRLQLALIHCLILVLGNQPEQAEDYLRAINLTPEKLQAVGQTSEVAPQALVYWVVIASMQENAVLTEGIALQALKLLSPEDQFLRAIVSVGLGYAYMLQGHLEAARQAYQQGLNIAEESTNLLVTFIAATRLGNLERLSGNLNEAERVYRRAMDYSRQVLPQTQLSILSWLLVCLTPVLYEWNELDQAEQLTCEALSLSQPLANNMMQVSCYLSLTRIKQARGQISAAGEFLKQAEILNEKYNTGPLVRVMAKAWRVRMCLKQGQLAAARDIIQQPWLDEDTRAGYVYEIEQISRARVYLAEGNTTQAIDLLASLLGKTETQGRLAVSLEILALQALAYQFRGETKKAFSNLKRIIDQARTQNFYRLFLDEGPAMAALLEVFKKTETGSNRIYLDRLLHWFGQETAVAVKSAVPEVKPATRHQLSQRELQIVRLLAKEYSNQQIVSDLQIAPGTVKKHLENIYAKLAVHSRTQAVSYALALRLI